MGKPSRSPDRVSGHSHGMCRSCLDMRVRALPPEPLMTRLRRFLAPGSPASPNPA